MSFSTTVLLSAIVLEGDEYICKFVKEVDEMDEPIETFVTEEVLETDADIGPGSDCFEVSDFSDNFSRTESAAFLRFVCNDFAECPKPKLPVCF